MQLLLFFLSPIGRYVGLALLVSAFLGGIYVKGVHDEKVRIQEKIIRESSKAITKADAARQSATQHFNAGRLRNDGWLRD